MINTAADCIEVPNDCTGLRESTLHIFQFEITLITVKLKAFLRPQETGQMVPDHLGGSTKFAVHRIVLTAPIHCTHVQHLQPDNCPTRINFCR